MSRQRFQSLGPSNFTQRQQSSDLGISLNKPDSQLTFGAQRNSANQPIRAQCASNEASVLTVLFHFNDQHCSLLLSFRSDFWTILSSQKFLCSHSFRALDALLHLSRQHSLIFSTRFDKIVLLLKVFAFLPNAFSGMELSIYPLLICSTLHGTR